MNYADFIAAKSALAPPVGIADPPPLHPALKPFQRDIVRWALKRGRAALFESTGLGKSFQQLEWARVICEETDGRVLILAPLGVAHQTVEEAAKWGIEGVAYATDQDSADSRIVVSNYERLHKFNMDDFAGLVPDESSIIKNATGKTRTDLIEASRDIPYKLPCTATPAPNDWIELGNHAELLGVMSEKEMLAMFFVHEGGVRANDGPEWRLKRHAASAFWEWVASWAVMIRSPADLGYDDPGYILPPLRKHQISVPVEYKPSIETGLLLPMEARTLRERLGSRRDSIKPRIDAALGIIAREPARRHVIWCGLNDEQDMIAAALGSRCVSIQGKDSDDAKLSKLRRWLRGEVPDLVSKLQIFGAGMNFQSCDCEIFLGMNDSFEGLFQGIRRCWRFGQLNPVDIYMIASELEGAVVANLERKERDFETMVSAMVGHMAGLSERAIRGGRQQVSRYNPQTKMELPAWMM